MLRQLASTLLIVATMPGILCGAESPEDLHVQESFATDVQPLFRQSCVHCHGKDDQVEGEVNLLKVQNADDLLADPALVAKLIEVLDSGYMPPEDEPPLADAVRQKSLTPLRALLRTAVDLNDQPHRTPIRRMNRFQYNNAVRDLFDLKVVVFPLSERMMREHGNYFQPQTGKMPGVVRVGSRPLGKSQMIELRLAGVTPFPQDLRAEHGFDNRGDHLSLSPLLMESFLRLGRSIVTSADFRPENCGIWPTFFAPPPADAELKTVVRTRLADFLSRAFRRRVEDKTLDRYTQYVLTQIENGEPFVESMKSVAAATLASPQFLYLYDTAAEESEAANRVEANRAGADLAPTDRPIDDYALASRLSFFLWGSIPDQTLLDLAATGKLSQPKTLAEQVDRMLRDRRLKRFCDSFPSQWLQLERIISSTPDPEQFPQFYFAKYRASMHMMLEPLLLFETLLIENQSILKLIDSDFSYRSELLQSWYRDGSQGKAGPPVVVVFHRVPVSNRREGGVITNAAVMTMTSTATRTQPITRGAWVASVILNDPPKPPPADVPPLPKKTADEEKGMTLRERLAVHRQRADCAGCHRRIDPLGFALENYNAAGIWRDTFANGRKVDPSGTLFGRHDFENITEFKAAILLEKNRFAHAFAAHLLSFALGREIEIQDAVALDKIVERTADDDYRFHAMIREIVLSDPFRY